MNQMFETYAQLQAYQETLVDRWAKAMPAAFEHNKKKKDRLLMAQLLTNYEYRNKVRESDITNSVAGTTTTNFPANFAWPMIVQVFPNLVANKLVDIQPMNGPVGLIFYRAFEYSNTANGRNANDSFQHQGSYAQSSEVPGSVNRGRVVFKSFSVSAQSMKLRAQWSSEVAEDARVLANFDMETDMLAALRDEILGEIDGQILNDLMNLPDQYGYVTAGNVTFDPNTVHSWEGIRLHREELLDALIDADVLVYKQRFVPTDYVIGHPNCVAYLQKLEAFAVTNLGVDGGGVIGARNVGTLNNRWNVYTSPHMPNTDHLLLGVQGTGYVFSPYIPLELTPAVYLYDSDETTRGMRTRFAKLKTDGNYLATVTVSGA